MSYWIWRRRKLHFCFRCVTFKDLPERSWNLTFLGHEISWNLSRPYVPCEISWLLVLMGSGPLPGAFVTWCTKWDGGVTALPKSLLRPVARSWHLWCLPVRLLARSLSYAIHVLPSCFRSSSLLFFWHTRPQQFLHCVIFSHVNFDIFKNWIYMFFVACNQRIFGTFQQLSRCTQLPVYMLCIWSWCRRKGWL